MNFLDLPHYVMRQIGNADKSIPRNSEKAIQEELDNIEMRANLHHINAGFGHMDFGARDDVRKHPHWPYTQHDSFVFLAKLRQMHKEKNYAGIIQGLYQFMNNELVQMSGLVVLCKIMRDQTMCNTLDFMIALCDEIYNVACASIRAYPATLGVLNAACDVLYLIIMYTNPSRSQ